MSDDEANDKEAIEAPEVASESSSSEDATSKKSKRGGYRPAFPRMAVKDALRIPQAILDQNAGKSCSRKEAAAFCGSKVHGPFNTEISASKKYGFLEQQDKGEVSLTPLALKILKPKDAADELEGYREAIQNAPEISEVYQHYRGENLPDDKFFRNTLADDYRIASEYFADFRQVFLDSLRAAELLEEGGGRLRVLDETQSEGSASSKPGEEPPLKRPVLRAAGKEDLTCFVMQPFSNPYGTYYDLLFKPAITKAGLRPLRADADIFGAGKIMDQIWSGIHASDVLLAELTTRNPNVFYELGIAHALRKPVVLVSSNEEDVPFDLQHIRVIYYDSTDPFWGEKLMAKVAENLRSAIEDPEEAVLPAPVV